MRRLKIRTRMTLWFVLSTVLVTATLFLALDSIVQAALMRGLREDLSLAIAQIGAQVEHEQGNLMYEDETPIASGIFYYVLEGSGSELISHGEDIAQFDSLPIREGEFSQLTLAEEQWLVLDSEPITGPGARGCRLREHPGHAAGHAAGDAHPLPLHRPAVPAVPADRLPDDGPLSAPHPHHDRGRTAHHRRSLS